MVDRRGSSENLALGEIRGFIANRLLWGTWENPFDFFGRLADETQSRFNPRVLLQASFDYEDRALGEVVGEATSQNAAYKSDQLAFPERQFWTSYVPAVPPPTMT